MAMSISPAQIERLRRQAKKLGREISVTHSEALDRIAVQNGFCNWSLLAKHNSDPAAAAPPSRPAPLRPVGSVRHYLHGDVSEDDASLCYCTRCDEFFPHSHLLPDSYHTDGKDGDRYLSSLARWNDLAREEQHPLFRPEQALNILEAPTRSAKAARDSMRSPFHRWLDSQGDRRDPVGDLARDVLRDDRFPIAASTRGQAQAYLEQHGSHVVLALRQAWREFSGRGDPESSLAEALAAELDISIEEAEELVDVEPQELTGHSGDGAYGFEFDFSDVASPGLAAKLLRSHGSLQLTVGPSFFDDLFG